MAKAPDRTAGPVTLRDAPSAAEPRFEPVWSVLERNSSSTFHPRIRQYIQRQFVDYGDCDKYDLTNPADEQPLQEAFALFATRELPKLAALLSKDREREGPLRVKKPRLRGKRPVRKREREKNSRLLAFVAERVVPFGRLMDGELKPGRLGRQGVPWDVLLAEWTMLNPDPADWIPSADALKVAHYAAARNPHLAREFLTQLQVEVEEAWHEAESALEKLRQWYAGLTEEERSERFESPIQIQITEEDWRPVRESQQRLKEVQQKHRAFLESLSPEEREAWEKASAQRERERIRRERDAIPRTDLIKHRVFWLVWRIPDEDPEKDQQRWQSPLRDWFLPEARGEHVPYFMGQYDTLEKWRSRKADRLREAQPESSHSKATRRPTSAKSPPAAKRKVAQPKRERSAKRKSTPKKRTSRRSR